MLTALKDHPAARLHADRAAGRHRHHRHPDRPAAAGGAEGPRGRRPHQVRQQPQADSAWPPTTTTTRIEHLPPGIGYYPPATNGAFGTYFFHLLPYLEQGNLYRSALGSVPFPPPVGPTAVYYPGNNNVYSQPVPVFLCPSDPSVGPGGVVTIDGVFVRRVLLRAQCPGDRAERLTSPVHVPQGKTRIRRHPGRHFEHHSPRREICPLLQHDHAAGVPGRRHGVGVLHGPARSPGCRRP